MRTTALCCVLLLASCGQEGVDRSGGVRTAAYSPQGIHPITRAQDPEDTDKVDLPDFAVVPPAIPPGFDECDYVSSHCQAGCLIDVWSCCSGSCTLHVEAAAIACCENLSGSLGCPYETCGTAKALGGP